MRRYISLGVIAAIALSGLALAETPKPPALAEEQDFGDRVIAVTLRITDEKKDNRGGWLTKARVQRLGDRYFIVGEPPKFKEEGEDFSGMKLWIPLSEVVQLLEFKDVETAKRSYDKFERAPGPKADK
jgi:hypothetical protein